MRVTWRMLASRRDLRLVLAAGLVSGAGDVNRLTSTCAPCDQNARDNRHRRILS